MAIFKPVRDWAGDQWDNITGETQADAAEQAAQIQADAANSAAQLQSESAANQLAFQEQQAGIARDDLQPFTQFGAGFIPQVNAQNQNTASLYGAQGQSDFMNSPMVQAIMQQNRDANLNNAAVGGRLGTGGFEAGLQSSALTTGFGLLNQERQANQSYLGQLMSGVQMGQNSAAGQANTSNSLGVNSANTMQNSVMNQNNLTTSGAASQAAGVMGAANASAAGTGNLISLGTSALGAMGGMPGMFGSPTMSVPTGSGVGVSNGLGGTINSPMGFGGS